jgi:hypothetical protein
LRTDLLQEGSLLLVQFNEMRENVGPSRRSWWRVAKRFDEFLIAEIEAQR